jgi:hypothetical protein
VVSLGRRAAFKRLSALLLALLSMGAALGCVASSNYMTEVAPAHPVVGVSDKATVVFLRPSAGARALTTTLLDEGGKYLGDSLPESHFITWLSPGEHTFIAWADNTAALKATLEAGKVYFVEVVPLEAALSTRIQLLALTPRSAHWSYVDEWLLKTRQYAADARAGQERLASRAEYVKEQLRRGHDALTGYDEDELAERTLKPEDGR